MKKISLSFLAVAGCILLAVFFVFNHIGARSYWCDEAAMAEAISVPFSQLYERAIIDSHPIFYLYLAKIWSLVFGDGEIALRSLSAIFFLLLVGFIYKVGSYIFKSKSAGLWAAFLAATNYFMIFWSMQAGRYAFSALIGLASFYFLIKLTRKPEKLDYLFYILFSVIGAYSHPWLSLVFGSQILSILFFRKVTGNFWKIIKSQLAVILLVLPNALIMISQAKWGISSWIARTDISALFESLKYMSRGNTIGYLAFSVLAIIFIFIYRKKQKISAEEKFAAASVIIYLISAPIFAFIVSLFKPIYVAGRYEMIIMPAFILLLAYLFSKIKNKYILFFIVPFIIIFSYNGVLADKKEVDSYKSSEKSVAAGILENLKDGDIVIATDLSWTTQSFYLDKLNKEAKKDFKLIPFPEEMALHPGWRNAKQMLIDWPQYEKEADGLIKQIEETKNKDNQVWVLYSGANLVSRLLYGKMAKNFNLVGGFQPLQPRESSWLDAVFVFN
ncbi:MAG: glycosyltransferase family 39 protein [Candidatus Pacebacteria bacterium]|nr:glycosyltransferase family 39 protein [Candidatus Paceibacterota bacterium]